jgi:hypothetical protein
MVSSVSFQERPQDTLIVAGSDGIQGHEHFIVRDIMPSKKVIYGHIEGISQ